MATNLPPWVSEAMASLLELASAEASNKQENYYSYRLGSHLLCSGTAGLPRWTAAAINQNTHTAPATLTLLNRIVGSPKAPIVWAAFERFGTPPATFLIELCWQAHRHLDNFERLAITKKARKAAGSKIRTLALRLATELSNPAVVASLESAGRRTGVGVRVRGPSPESLLKLAAAASAMGDLPTSIAQPNGEDAHRLYFIRGMTAWAYKTMKTPMRSQIFALTSVFFDMGNLTADQLATLAPVRKQADETPVSLPKVAAEKTP